MEEGLVVRVYCGTGKLLRCLDGDGQHKSVLLHEAEEMMGFFDSLATTRRLLANKAQDRRIP